MPASPTDVREWARKRGIDIKGRGRIPDEVQAQYDAAADAGELGGQADELELEPDDVVGGGPLPPPPPPPPAGETRPRRPRGTAGGRGPFAGLFNRGGRRQARPRRQTAARGRGRGSGLPRVSLAGLIEDGWSDMAWASGTIAPLQRLLYAQAPFAGIGLEGALAGTFIDRALQPVARAQAKAEVVGGLLMPPAALMLVLATAPQPYEIEEAGQTRVVYPAPSMQHKGALLSFRWSIMLMAKAGQMHLTEYKMRAEERAELGRQADTFMAYILGIPEQAPGPEDEAAAAARAEDEAVARAQAMFGGPPLITPDGDQPG